MPIGLRLTIASDTIVIAGATLGTGIPDLTPKAVQLAIKYKHSMICMEMQSGPWMSALLGSITKQVLRSSPCPVVVLNSAYLNKAAQTSSRKRAARIERKAA